MLHVIGNSFMYGKGKGVAHYCKERQAKGEENGQRVGHRPLLLQYGGYPGSKSVLYKIDANGGKADNADRKIEPFVHAHVAVGGLFAFSCHLKGSLPFCSVNRLFIQDYPKDSHKGIHHGGSEKGKLEIIKDCKNRA